MAFRQNRMTQRLKGYKYFCYKHFCDCNIDKFGVNWQILQSQKEANDLVNFNYKSIESLESKGCYMLRVY